MKSKLRLDESAAVRIAEKHLQETGHRAELRTVGDTDGTIVTEGETGVALLQTQD